jgi:hypothetical protein
VYNDVPVPVGQSFVLPSQPHTGELSRDDLGRSSALQSPSVVVIGDVVALSLILRDAIAAHHPA